MHLSNALLFSGLPATFRSADAAPAAAPEAGQPAAPVNPGDRRADDRMPLVRGGMLELAGRRRMAVNLVDLSEGGAAVLARGIDAAPGMAGALVLDTALLPVSVVAASGGRIHLAFQALPPEAESALARLLAKGAGPALAA